MTGFYAIYRPAKPPSPGIPIKPVLTGLSIISQRTRVCVFTTTLFIPFGLRYFGGAGHTEFFVFSSTLAIQPLANGWSPVAEREMKKPFATELLVVTLPNYSNGIRKGRNSCANGLNLLLTTATVLTIQHFLLFGNKY
jgi:hypothetical protein